MLHVGYDFVDKRSITFSHVLAMDKRPFSTVLIIGLEPPRPRSTLWFGLFRTVYPGLGVQDQLSILYSVFIDS